MIYVYITVVILLICVVMFIGAARDYDETTVETTGQDYDEIISREVDVQIRLRDGAGRAYALAENLEESNRCHVTNSSAIVSLLIRSGIITPEEWDREQVRVSAKIDQVFERGYYETQ